MSATDAKDHEADTPSSYEECDWRGFFQYSSKRQTSLKGSRILLPESVLTKATNANWAFPLYFMVTIPGRQDSEGNPCPDLVCGVKEFNADADTCVLPVWMLEQLKYEPGQDMMFRVRHLTHAPEKADYIKYQPHNYAFDKILMNAGTLFPLQQALRDFNAIKQGTTIKVKIEEQYFPLDILETKPAKIVNLLGFGDVDSECNLDPLPAKDAKAKRFAIDNPGLAGSVDIWSDDDEPEAFVRECLEQRKAHNHSNKENKDAHADISGRGVLVHDIFDDQDEVVSLMPGQMSCPVCSESVSASYLQHHLVSCNITYMLCPSDECGQLIRRTDQKRHIKFGHKKVSCDCGLRLMQCKLYEHQTDGLCASRMLCSYCSKIIRLKELGKHMDICSNSTVPCPVCRVFVSQKDLRSGAHSLLCRCTCECGESVPTAQMSQHKTRCSHRMVPCPWCHNQFQFRYLAPHKESCDAKPSWTCERCSGKNADNKQTCDFCGGPNPANAPADTWSCSTCTVFNPRHRITCEVCNVGRRPE